MWVRGVGVTRGVLVGVPAGVPGEGPGVGTQKGPKALFKLHAENKT